MGQLKSRILHILLRAGPATAINGLSKPRGPARRGDATPVRSTDPSKRCDAARRVHGRVERETHVTDRVAGACTADAVNTTAAEVRRPWRSAFGGAAGQHPCESTTGGVRIGGQPADLERITAPNSPSLQLLNVGTQCR